MLIASCCVALLWFLIMGAVLLSLGAERRLAMIAGIALCLAPLAYAVLAIARAGRSDPEFDEQVQDRVLRSSDRR